MPPRVRLSAGASTVNKVVFTVLGVFLVCFSFGFLLVGFGLAFGRQTAIGSSLPDGSWYVDENGNLVEGTQFEGFDNGPLGYAGLAAMLAGLLIALFAVYVVLKVVRSASWLEGSRLYQRGALRTRSANLATAEVGAGSAMQSTGSGESRNTVAVQSLTAREEGKTVVLPIRRAGAVVLPSDQLMMLANAITNQRTRQGDDDQAFVVAERLRDFAKDPFS
jgi:hypothetical protein